MTVPFVRAWWSFELGDVRPCVNDYDMFPYESLPPINERLFKGKFTWLGADEDPEDADVVDLGDDDEDDLDDEEEDEDGEEDEDEGAPTDGRAQRMRLASLSAELAKVGAELPAPFLKFMGSGAMQDAVPTCTGCNWDLSEHPIESPFEDDAWLVRFLRDPEGALNWYLHITKGGTYVVVSPVAFDDPKLDEPPAALLAKTYWCAPHFENFVYRFWLENVLWELLEDGVTLTPAEAAYVAHYKPKAAKAPKKKA